MAMSQQGYCPFACSCIGCVQDCLELPIGTLDEKLSTFMEGTIHLKGNSDELGLLGGKPVLISGEEKGS